MKKKKRAKKPKWSSKPFEKERAVFLEKQGGCCAICNKAEMSFSKRLSLDHNHKTGKLRGLLCYRCNKFIVGRHDYESALKLLNYLRVEVE